MSTNEKDRELTPAEERRRKEARRKRWERERKRRQRQRLLLILALVFAVVILVAAIVLIVKKVSGKKQTVESKSETVVVVLDPGHGGEDLGMSCGDVLEKDVTADICAKLKVMLESQDIQVVMTRSDDSRISKEDRVGTVNSADAVLFVSIHCGYSQEESTEGAVTHYQSGNKTSKSLSQSIQSALVKESGAEDGGTDAGDYTILTDSEIPGVLVEVGYLSNNQEGEKLGDDSYQNDLAKGIAKGILASLD